MSATMLGKRKEEHDRGGQGPEALVGDNPTDFQDDVDSFIQELSNENFGVGLEANDEEIESDGEGDHGYDTGNESGERGRSNKKQRIYESQMPWFSAEQRVRKKNTKRSCNKTRNTSTSSREIQLQSKDG
jgi:hypothetical protein